MNIKDMRYKEVSPENTVKRLKQILKDNNIELCENWQETSSVGTYALRLTIKDLDFGQNGKGMTKDFALASAYAEFFERYQNGILCYKLEKPTPELPFSLAPDEKEMTVQDFINENSSFINNLTKDYNNKKEILSEIFNENSKLIKSKKEHTSLPYYSLKENRLVHVPYLLFRYIYTTNGMCAGNSPEEAMIEGISEILERYVSIKLFHDKTAFPEIPDSYIEKFPTVKSMLEKIQNNSDHIYKLVDCSLGGKYPVAGLFIIQKNTGKFGFKLGAHPDFGIAMERCFTEAAQGIDIYDYAQSCMFDFDNTETTKNANIKEFLDTYVATIPYQIWQQTPTYEFVEMPDVSHLTNSEILNSLTKQITDDGYDILIRDSSVFGFPTYSIIIPGMSEINNGPMASRFNTVITLSEILKNLNLINTNNVKELITILKTVSNEIGIENLSMYSTVKNINSYPCETFGMGCKFLLSLCYIMDKQYDKATEILENIMFLGENLSQNPAELTLVKAVYYYASGMNQLKNHEETMHYINILFTKEIADYIDTVFENANNILTSIYHLTKDDFVEYDDAYYLPFMDVLRHQQMKNKINQIDLKDIFKNSLNNRYSA